METSDCGFPWVSTFGGSQNIPKKNNTHTHTCIYNYISLIIIVMFIVIIIIVIIITYHHYIQIYVQLYKYVIVPISCEVRMAGPSAREKLHPIHGASGLHLPWLELAPEQNKWAKRQWRPNMGLVGLEISSLAMRMITKF